jgi:hypothetical protein
MLVWTVCFRRTPDEKAVRRSRTLSLEAPRYHGDREPVLQRYGMHAKHPQAPQAAEMVSDGGKEDVSVLGISDEAARAYEKGKIEVKDVWRAVTRRCGQVNGDGQHSSDATTSWTRTRGLSVPLPQSVPEAPAAGRALQHHVRSEL